MMKRGITIVLLTVAMAMGRSLMAAELSGDWIAQTGGSGGGEPQYTRVSLKVDGARLGGMWGMSKIDGTLADGKLDIKLTDAQGNSAGALTGTVSGETITGTGTILGGGGGRGGFGGGGGGMGGGRGAVTAAAGAAPAAGLATAAPAAGGRVRGGGGGGGEFGGGAVAR